MYPLKSDLLEHSDLGPALFILQEGKTTVGMVKEYLRFGSVHVPDVFIFVVRSTTTKIIVTPTELIFPLLGSQKLGYFRKEPLKDSSCLLLSSIQE